jgi:hypothetical protein
MYGRARGHRPYWISAIGDFGDRCIAMYGRARGHRPYWISAIGDFGDPQK